jgi:hypothetical protein
MWNSYEQEILTIVDKIAPFEEVGSSTKRKVSKNSEIKAKLEESPFKKTKTPHQTRA